MKENAMTARVVKPVGRGFLMINSHPAGCARTVTDMWEHVPPAQGKPDQRPVALILGSSAGYGLAAAVAGLARYGIRGIGVCFEQAPQRRTGTAGWYRTITTARLAAEAGSDFVFVNGDAYSDEIKTEVLDLIEQRFGKLDYLIYSLVTYSSVIKPIGEAHRTKTLAFDADGEAELTEVEVAPASGDDVEQTVKVMGGEDWARWVDALTGRDLLNTGFTTVALSYIGSDLTSAIYREGTIGAAKKDLEQTARELTRKLEGPVDGFAFTSVNGAAVTQSSNAIPGIALYAGLLRGVLGDAMVPPIDQLIDLWDRLTGTKDIDSDDVRRIRLDTWELDPKVQAAVTERWQTASPENITELADLEWFRTEFHQLYGFAVPGVDYDQEVEVDVPWPAAP
jgi:enoyl-[acyl-carrier protein] reductase/trans-2-enoyl-CoA reductase (NAD+)